MADVFVSYTSSDRDWAFWIGQELGKLGHTAHVHEWEIPAGGDIAAWMDRTHDNADHILCVISKVYLTKGYSSWERRAAQWAAASKRPNFTLPVFIEDCEPPTLLAPIKGCYLFGVSEGDARVRLAAYLAPVATPAGPVRFPGDPNATIMAPARPQQIAFPGSSLALSNIPITVPRHFVGRADALLAIDAALKRYDGRVAITALHGLRGIGKTTLAAAYAERHRADYRATWWIRAQTEPTMRADLTAFGVRLGWVLADEKEVAALAAIRERLQQEGDGILLIYDNAIDAAGLRRYLPPGGAARVLVTSNAHVWRGIAEPVEIRLWPKQVGADYLIARTGREKERADAEALSQTLGGLPLAHEQAAAYCERLDISLAEYCKRFETAPARLLDDAKHAPVEHNDGMTVAKSFALAIDEAAKQHPAAEPLIVRAAMLAPEPIPLFLFVEGREKFGQPLASLLEGDGLDEALAALRSFALVDRETIADERDPTYVTETIRLHRLVREVAAVRCLGEAKADGQRAWIEVIAKGYPSGVFDDPSAWPRARRLDALALDLVGGDAPPPSGAETSTSYLLTLLGQHRHRALAAYSQARPLFERALAICEKALGGEHPETAESINNLGYLLFDQGDLAGAGLHYERALAVREKTLGPEHPQTATSLKNLASVHVALGNFASARRLLERALAIREKAIGPEHPDTAGSFNDLANVLSSKGDLADTLSLYERALVIYEKARGPERPSTAASLDDLSLLLGAQSDLADTERLLAIYEKALGPEHHDTAKTLNNLAALRRAQGDLAGAQQLFERALAILEKALGPKHPVTATTLHNLASLLQAQGDLAGARPLFERAVAIREKAFGPEHPDTAQSLNDLALLLRAQSHFAGAQPLFERALAIYEKSHGCEHPYTNTTRTNLAGVRLAEGAPSEARSLAEAALAAHERSLGPNHALTQTAARVTADALDALGRSEEAIALRARYGVSGNVSPLSPALPPPG